MEKAMVAAVMVQINLEQKLLRVQVHPMSNPRSKRAIADLLEQRNAAECTYPATNLRLDSTHVFSQGADQRDVQP